MNANDFAISYVPSSLSGSEWVNRGTDAGNDITQLKYGEIERRFGNGNALCFPQMGANGVTSGDSFITYVNYDINSRVNKQITMEVWVYPYSYEGKTWIGGHDDGGYDRGLYLHDFRFGGIAAGVGYKYKSSIGYAPINEWTQVVVVYDGDRKLAKIYKNGLLGDTLAIGSDSGSGQTKIGLNGLKNHANHNFHGCIGRFQITNRALSDDEVANLFKYQHLTHAIILLGFGTGQQKTWHDAQNECRSTYGTHLARIDNAAENEYARQLCKDRGQQFCWIGMRHAGKNANEYTFQWEDAHIHGYWENFDEGRPVFSKNQELVVVILGAYPGKSGEWWDVSMLFGHAMKLYFFCERIDSTFILIKQSKTWHDANNYCKSTYGTRLARIYNRIDNDKAYNLCNGAGQWGCWIGLRHAGSEYSTEYNFEWIENNLWTNFKGGKPITPLYLQIPDLAVAIRGTGPDSGTWVDRSPANLMYFFCQTPHEWIHSR